VHIPLKKEVACPGHDNGGKYRRTSLPSPQELLPLGLGSSLLLLFTFSPISGGSFRRRGNRGKEFFCGLCSLAGLICPSSMGAPQLLAVRVSRTSNRHRNFPFQNTSLLINPLFSLFSTECMFFSPATASFAPSLSTLFLDAFSSFPLVWKPNPPVPFHRLFPCNWTFPYPCRLFPGLLFLNVFSTSALPFGETVRRYSPVRSVMAGTLGFLLTSFEVLYLRGTYLLLRVERIRGLPSSCPSCKGLFRDPFLGGQVASPSAEPSLVTPSQPHISLRVQTGPMRPDREHSEPLINRPFFLFPRTAHPFSEIRKVFLTENFFLSRTRSSSIRGLGQFRFLKKPPVFEQFRDRPLSPPF